MTNIRLPHWLWASKIFPTEAVAREHINEGNVKINNKNAYPRSNVEIGDKIKINYRGEISTYLVQALRSKRNNKIGNLCTKLSIVENEFRKNRKITNSFLGRRSRKLSQENSELQEH